jgi:hypothetical protein
MLRQLPEGTAAQLDSPADSQKPARGRARKKAGDPAPKPKRAPKKATGGAGKPAAPAKKKPKAPPGEGRKPKPKPKPAPEDSDEEEEESLGAVLNPRKKKAAAKKPAAKKLQALQELLDDGTVHGRGGSVRSGLTGSFPVVLPQLTRASSSSSPSGRCLRRRCWTNG